MSLLTPAITLNGGGVSNPKGGSDTGYPCFIYNRDDKVVCSLKPDEIKYGQTFVATYLTVHLGSSARRYLFAKAATVQPGDHLILSLGDHGKQTATVVGGNTSIETIELVREASTDPAADDAFVVAYNDTYLQKVFALAQVHALLGSSKEDFNKALSKSNIRDTADVKKLTKDQFNAVNVANGNVRLEGTRTDQSEDQERYDEATMLACCVNTRLNAIHNAQHPAQYDLSQAKGQLEAVNNSANLLFNAFYGNLGSFVSTYSMSTQQVKHSYNSVNIQLEAIRDLFSSLALPEATLVELLGSVKSFVDSVKQISASATDKTLKNAKMVNFYSIQPPVANPKLAHEAVMRMIYVAFNEAAFTWTSNCASGETFNIDVLVFTLDVALNKDVIHLTYDHLKQKTIEAADVTIDELGGGGTPATVPPLKTNGPSPLGPPPISMST